MINVAAAAVLQYILVASSSSVILMAGSLMTMTTASSCSRFLLWEQKQQQRRRRIRGPTQARRIYSGSDGFISEIDSSLSLFHSHPNRATASHRPQLTRLYPCRVDFHAPLSSTNHQFYKIEK